VASFLRAFWNGLIPLELRRDPDVLRQAKRVAAFDLAMFIWVVVFTSVYLVLDAPICASAVGGGGLILLVILLALRRGKSPALCGNLFCFAAWSVYTTLTVFTGGAGSPPAMWFASIPVLAIFLCGNRSAVLWTSASMVAITILALAREFGFQCPNELTASGLRFIQFSGLVGLVSCVYLLVWVLTNMEHSARQALHEANRRLEFQASTDGLTGIANRRSFDYALEHEWRRHQRTGLPISLLLIDVDFFKDYNDLCGHLAGDDCLRSLAQVIQACIHRPGDLVARYGGEEFAVILSSTNEAGTNAVAENVRLGIRALEIPHPRSAVSPHVTISIGMVTAVPGREDSYVDLLHEADVALYCAKRTGRDRVVHAAELITASA